MNIPKLTFKVLAVLSVLTYSAVILLTPHSVSAAPVVYDSSRLIDDFVFRDNTGYSATDIQTFLTSINSGLANYHDVEDCGSPAGSHYTYYTQYYSCGQSVLASKIIYDASQAYGINPRAILATMQKEQSLVTNPSPTQSEINCAMGYYSCGSFIGFFNQVDNGTWQFRTYMELGLGNNWWGYTPSSYPCSQGGVPAISNGGNKGAGSRYYNPGLYPGNDITFFDYDGTPYTHFVINNMATAGMYCYTPHVYPGSSKYYYSGSYNFVYWYNQWWGSTYANDTFSPHPDGTLISSGGHVYLIGSDGKKHWITNGDVFNSYGYPWFQVKVASTGDATVLTSGDPISTLAPGTIFHTDNNPAVYVMTYENGNLVKQQISAAVFDALGYNWDEVVYVPLGNVPGPATTSSSILFANQHPAGTLVAGGGKAYLLDQTSKRWILNPDAFNTNNFDWNKVKTGTTQDLALPEGTPVDLRQGNMLISGGSIYLVAYNTDGIDGILKKPVGPWECFADRWHYAYRDLYQTVALPDRTGSIATC